MKGARLASIILVVGVLAGAFLAVRSAKGAGDAETGGFCGVAANASGGCCGAQAGDAAAWLGAPASDAQRACGAPAAAMAASDEDSCCGACETAAKARPASVEVGQPAPEFSLPDQDGKIHRLEEYRGRRVILAFYPKDMTGGCTCEMGALRDVGDRIRAAGATLFGVSVDTAESHRRFAEKEKLNFPLLADPEKKVVAAYGVLGPNGLAQRVTFVIGPDGKIENIDRAVNSQFSSPGGVLTSRHGADLVLLLSDWKAEVGKPVPNFSLPGIDGTTASLLQPGKKAMVVVFVSTTCPVSRGYDERLKALAAAPAYRDVAFLAINSNATEPLEQVQADAKEQQYPFPVAKDWKNAIADHFGASATPTAWVIAADGTALYRGAVDDSSDPANVKVSYLKDALNAVLAGKPVALAETRPFGCAIKRQRGA